MLTRVLAVAVVAALASSCGGSQDKRTSGAPFELYYFERDLVRAGSAAGGERLVTCSGFCPRAVSGRVSFKLVRDPALTGADIDPKSVQVGSDPATGRSAVGAQFTAEGGRKFRRLTQTLASRGRALGYAQHVAIVVDDRVVGAPLLDYLRFPDGVDPSTGIEIAAGSRAAATKLARSLRGD